MATYQYCHWNFVTSQSDSLDAYFQPQREGIHLQFEWISSFFDKSTVISFLKDAKKRCLLEEAQKYQVFDLQELSLEQDKFDNMEK